MKVYIKVNNKCTAYKPTAFSDFIFPASWFKEI